MSNPTPEDLLSAVITQESQWKAKAENKKSGARGLGQITRIALKDFNQAHPKEQFSFDDMYEPQRNMYVSNWMLNERIPQMLKAYNIPVTTENILASYNFGIGNVKKGAPLPAETRGYIKNIRQYLGETQNVHQIKE